MRVLRHTQMRKKEEMVQSFMHVLLSILVLCSSSAFGALHRPPAQYSPSCNQSLVVRCGKKVAKVRDPFTRLDVNGSCKSLITCKNGNFRIEINSFEYYVSSIDYAGRTLVIYPVADDQLDLNICPSRLNTSMDVVPFGYTESDMLITQLRNSSGASADALPGVAWCGSGCCYTTGDPALVQSMYGELQFMPVMRSQFGRPLGEGSLGVLQALESGLEVTWAARDGASGCEACVQSGGVCRNLPAPHSFAYCYCPRHGVAYMYKCPSQECCTYEFARQTDGGKDHKSPVKFVIGGVVASVIFLLLCLLFYIGCLRTLHIPILHMKQRNPRKGPNLAEFLEKFGSLPPKRYSFSDVQKMTFNFKHSLGHGGYGNVYKGKLEDDRLVAVKVLNSSQGSGKDFFSEVISIGYTYHVNIVNLLGFCLEDSHRILIYEFMPNGSLEKFIYATKDETGILDRKMLLRIAIGIARGLQYLHHGCNIGILHFDIKPSNILLDENFCPKIADFGLAKICRSAERKMKMLDAGGTVGYVAPEVFLRKFGGVSSKSDVYSYGMMLLEMVGGRKKIYWGMNNTSETFLPHWIYKHIDLDGGLISSSIMTEAEGEVARRMVIIGLWCIQTNPSDRPSMSKVMDMLEGRIAELQMPPMPFLYSPLVSANSLPLVNQFQVLTSDAASSSKQSFRDTIEPES